MKHARVTAAVVVAAAVVAAAGIAAATGSGPARPAARAGSSHVQRALFSSWMPMIALPPGFAPIASYPTLLKDYEFSGMTMPADWAPSADTSYGDHATEFQPSQVSMTGNDVAFTAIRHSSAPNLPYTSGAISTQGRFSLNYGMLDFRAKMPAGQGLWSGLWLDQAGGSDPWGEIDVAELLLGDTHAVYGSLHEWSPPPLWGETQGTRMAADASQGFHDYELIWQPGMITWALDGVAYAQYTKAQAQAAGHPWAFDDGTGFYLIADLAVAAASEWGGGTDRATVFPATMQLQWIRIWR